MNALTENIEATLAERDTWDLLSIGYSSKEIAYEQGISTHTSNKHISNLKPKVGYQKKEELAVKRALEHYGLCFEDYKREILESVRARKEKACKVARKGATAVMIIGSIFSITPRIQGRSRCVQMRSRYRIEYNVSEVNSMI